MAMLESDALIGLLDMTHRNHSVIANNLANLNTPGFRTQRVRFVQELAEALDRSGRVREGRGLSTELYRPMFGEVSADGNDVLLARELGELHRNTLKMKLYLEVLGGRIRKLRLAIEGR